ncbi:MAG: Vacuolar protein sorting-associated protein 54 [Chrysothrix sp. TS-e1954]|nr:MAG: Vacuolar protein sorting-associated protein 54 [Chrysothrix sp. TS-e1954]
MSSPSGSKKSNEGIQTPKPKHRRSSSTLQSPPQSARSTDIPPLPRLESFQRPNDRYAPHSRRSSGASIASSVGGPLEPSTSKVTTTVNEYRQNAISTLLAPPIVRTGLVPHTSLPTTSGHRPPTARDIPPVNLTSIRHVDKSAFKSYLDTVGPLFENYQRAKAADEDSSYFTAHHVGQHKRSSSQISIPSTPQTPSTVLSPPSSPQATKRPSPTRRTTHHGPTPLSTVPKVYFDENFHLENPRTFDVVSEYAEVIPPERGASRDGSVGTPNGSITNPAPTRRKALHTNAILQEKLSWYLDTVEVHLIASIATASSSFFAALGSLKELQSEAEESITRIKSLRSTLQKLDVDMATSGLEVVSLRRKRENVRKLGEAVSQLCEVAEEAKACEDLVDAGEAENATRRLESLEQLIAGEQRTSRGDVQRFDLRKLKALQGLSEGIFELRLRIGKVYESKFIECLLSDLREHVKAVPSKVTMQRWANASYRSRSNHNRTKSAMPTYMQTNEALRPALLAALAGLSRAGHTARAAAAYREAIMREIKSTIRQHLPSSSDDDAESVASASTRGGRRMNQQEKSSILARNLRTLDAETFEELLVKIYTNVGELLRRLGHQTKVLLDVTSSIEPQPGVNVRRASSDNVQMSVQSPSGQVSQIREEVTQALDLSSLLGQAVDVIQTQVTKILKVRSEQNTRMALDSFTRYFALNRLFADECEGVCGRSGDGLKEVINSQVKEFLQRMAEEEKHHLAQALEKDRWDAKDFGPEMQQLLGHILDSMTTVPQAWAKYTSLWSDTESVDHSNRNGLTNGESKSVQETSKTTRSATIDSQKYILVQSAQDVVIGISRFSQLIVAIPSLTSEAAQRLLEYLKMFNSRACQLILGAGATRPADGLKNITSKHLALASQACSFVVALVPYMREFVRSQAPGQVTSSGLLAEFDKVKRLFQDHQSSINEKLVDIMTNRSSAHIAAMRKINFDSDATSQKSAYAQALTKETATLHRVLSRYVTESDVKMVMMPIFTSYETEWSKALRDVQVSTEAGQSRLMRDVEHIKQELGSMEGAGELGANLVRIVQQKETKGRTSVDVVNGRPSTDGTNTADSQDDEGK